MVELASKDDLFDLLFPIEKSIRYHQRRRKHYDGLHRSFMLLVILAGSASVADLFRQHQPLFGFLVAVLASADIVFALSDKARDHEFLMRRFCSLMAQIRSCAAPTQADVRRWRAERTKIETDEPATYWALEAGCYNEALRAMDRNPEDEVYIAWYKRLTKNFIQYDPTSFPTKKEKQAYRAKNS